MQIENITAKTILSPTKKSEYWFHYDYNMNLYRGCCHGCIYCDSRSDCYNIIDFDRVKAKTNAIELLQKELQSKRKKGIIGMGAMSDPYNPFETKLELTRKTLGLIEENKFGTAIFTKSNLIKRDIDILSKINQHQSVLCGITITCADDELCTKIEPHVSLSSERFQAIKELSEAGIYVGVLLMPILPFINDNRENIKSMIRLAKENGAKFIYPSFGVTLRSNQRQYYFDKLDLLYPDLKSKYQQTYGDHYFCESPNSKELWKVIKEECESKNILYKIKDINDGYIKAYKQMSLFDFYPNMS